MIIVGGMQRSNEACIVYSLLDLTEYHEEATVKGVIVKQANAVCGGEIGEDFINNSIAFYF